MDRSAAAQVIVDVRREQEDEHEPGQEDRSGDLEPGHQRLTIGTMVAASTAVRSSVRDSFAPTFNDVAAFPSRSSHSRRCATSSSIPETAAIR